ncbi:unnamed protein product [Heligmosomoides polygyrus]|uniref:Uncharacterized protein n=1 Tax=Heligmosomoides polygyrus TaxID=6339 RepID=A0A183G3W9_HELPZ|nr:unnamed protein product [Heligmosomoides polygyrus]
MYIEIGDGQFQNNIDHIIFHRKNCFTDVSVVSKFYNDRLNASFARGSAFRVKEGMPRREIQNEESPLYHLIC